MSKKDQYTKKAAEISKLFHKGEEFTAKLMRENEKLRYNQVSLEEEVKNLKKLILPEDSSGNRLKTLEDENRVLNNTNTRLNEKLKEVAQENTGFSNKYVEIEEDNNRLANLYIANYQLHSTLDYDEVLNIIMEIILNLIGGEKFSIMLLNDSTSDLVSIASEGMDAIKVNINDSSNECISKVFKNGESYFFDDSSCCCSNCDEKNDEPIICVPLKVFDQLIGLIVIYSLASQKEKKMTEVDYELFSMLTTHAGIAILSSRLYRESDKKINIDVDSSED